MRKLVQLPALIFGCASTVAIMFLTHNGSKNTSINERPEEEVQFQVSCDNETLKALHSRVIAFLDGDHQKRKTEDETAIVSYSKFMHMCARQAAISSCQTVAENGNYCKNDNIDPDLGYVSVVKEMKIFSGKRVASFGEGTGHFKREFIAETLVYDGFDGNPFIEFFSNGTVKFLDLSVPTHFPIKYDVTMSLKVIEHIPKQLEHIAVRNLAESSKDVLIISWANLGQGGLAHVNYQPREYVIKSFENQGFQLDNEASGKLRNGSSIIGTETIFSCSGRPKNELNSNTNSHTVTIKEIDFVDSKVHFKEYVVWNG